MRKISVIVVTLILGVCIGVIAPHIFSRDVDSSWRTVVTEGKYFGIGYDPSALFTDLPMPEIKMISGKAKFVDRVGPGQSTNLGYIINVEMGALDWAKVPQRYKEQTTEIANGYKVTTLPIEQASYAIEFDFDLKDQDSFVLQTVHAKGVPSLMSATKNTFQARTEDPIPYATAIKVQEILVRPSIVKCLTCKPAVTTPP